MALSTTHDGVRPTVCIEKAVSGKLFPSDYVYNTALDFRFFVGFVTGICEEYFGNISVVICEICMQRWRQAVRK